MRKIIEFQKHTPGEVDLISPWQTSPSAPFQDLILKPEYAGLKQTVPNGTSTFRILPAMKGSPQWMAPIHTLDHSNGRHAHPKSSQPSASSVFDTAQAWLKQYEPDTLYSKSNPNGFKLWGSTFGACWILVDGPEHPQLRIILASTFSGAGQSAKAGLGHKILELVRQHNQLLDPEEAYQVKVTRTYSEGSKFPETNLTVNRNTSSLNEALGELSAQDLKLICPIGDTIRQIDIEHEWVLLGEFIGKDLVAKIRSATAES